MAKSKKGLDKPNSFDSLSPFGQNNDLKVRMVVDSHQESYNSKVGGFQKTKGSLNQGKGPRVKSRRDI